MSAAGGGKTDNLRRRDKERDVRKSNILAGRAVADTVRCAIFLRGAREGRRARETTNKKKVEHHSGRAAWTR